MGRKSSYYEYFRILPRKYQNVHAFKPIHYSELKDTYALTIAKDFKDYTLDMHANIDKYFPKMYSLKKVLSCPMTPNTKRVLHRSFGRHL
jgi:hypothetical protein